MISKICGLAILLGSLAVVVAYEGAPSAAFASGALRIFYWPAILLTGLGPIGLVLLSSDRASIADALRILWSDSPTDRQRESENDSLVLQELSQDYYVSGSKVFERVDGRALSQLLRRTMERLAIKVPIQDLRELTEKESERVENRIQKSIAILGLGVRLSPSVGMLGTILGMFQLLSNLADTASIGNHMGLALLTTFYGLFFSLGVWSPLQHRLEMLLEAECHAYDQIVHWLALLEKRKPAEYLNHEFQRERGEARA